MKIVYSFNKKGFEADYWQQEIGGASNDEVTFLPFKHDPYLDVSGYSARSYWTSGITTVTRD